MSWSWEGSSPLREVKKLPIWPPGMENGGEVGSSPWGRVPSSLQSTAISAFALAISTCFTSKDSSPSSDATTFGGAER